MPTTEELNVFKNQILAPVGADANLNPNRWLYEVTGFLAIEGSEYSAPDGGLMAIGRSVNGWGKCGKFPVCLHYQEAREIFAEEVVQFIDVDGDPMQNYWGNNNNRSAFGRVIRQVVGGLEIPDFNEAIWPSYLVWSNLYKLSPHVGGNPNLALRDAQRTGCIQLLQVELETYRPERLLFLTGFRTGLRVEANLFLEALEINYEPMPIDLNFLFVEKFGRLTHHNNQLCKVVIACHPQTRPEDKWVHEVMKAFHILDGETI